MTNPASPGAHPVRPAPPEAPARPARRAPAWMPALAPPLAYVMYAAIAAVSNDDAGPFAEFWTRSAWFDVVFVAGTAGAAWVGWRLALAPGPSAWVSGARAFAASAALQFATWWMAISIGAWGSGRGGFWSLDPTWGASDGPSHLQLVFSSPSAAVLACALAMPLAAAYLRAGPARHRPASPPRVGPVTLAGLAALSVAVSTFLGLLTPSAGGLRHWGDVWSTNFAGDVTFTLGTMASFLLLWRLHQAWAGMGRWRAGTAVAASGLALHWLVYIANWGFSSGDGGFWSTAWHARMPGDFAIEAWRATLVYGWTGLVGMSVGLPLLAAYVADVQARRARHAQARPSAARPPA